MEYRSSAEPVMCSVLTRSKSAGWMSFAMNVIEGTMNDGRRWKSRRDVRKMWVADCVDPGRLDASSQWTVLLRPSSSGRFSIRVRHSGWDFCTFSSRDGSGTTNQRILHSITPGYVVSSNIVNSWDPNSNFVRINLAL